MAGSESLSPSNRPDATSLTLLERVRAQDESGWRRLVDLYSPLVCSWCLRSGLGREDAGDVVQEVFAAVAANIGRFRHERPEDTFRGWLRVIARNQVRLHFRRRQGQPPAVGGSAAQMRLQSIPDALPELAAEDTREELGALFRRGLEMIRCQFGERTWRAFWLVVVEDRRAIDVAQELGTTPGAVRQAKYEVLHRLRAELGDLLD